MPDTNKRNKQKKNMEQAAIPKHALCVSLEGLASRAESGDYRAQELLVEGCIYLERYLEPV